MRVNLALTCRTATVRERTLAATVRERTASPLPDGRGRGPLADARGSANAQAPRGRHAAATRATRPRREEACLGARLALRTISRPGNDTHDQHHEGVASVAPLRFDDDAPPPSGVRRRAPEAATPLPSDAQVVAEVAGEALAEVWALWRALSPLQGPWLALGAAQAGAALLAAARWRHEGEDPARCISTRWPELVPGSAAMDRLAWMMVDVVCR
jgi:hypothetical protein